MVFCIVLGGLRQKVFALKENYFRSFFDLLLIEIWTSLRSAHIQPSPDLLLLKNQGKM